MDFQVKDYHKEWKSKKVRRHKSDSNDASKPRKLIDSIDSDVSKFIEENRCAMTSSGELMFGGKILTYTQNKLGNIDLSLKIENQLRSYALISTHKRSQQQF